MRIVTRVFAAVVWHLEGHTLIIAGSERRLAMMSIWHQVVGG